MGLFVPVHLEVSSVEAESVEVKVFSIVSEALAVNKEEIKKESRFQDDLGADSLDLVELIMMFEEEFNIQIPEDHIEKIKTVGEATDYIRAHFKN